MKKLLSVLMCASFYSAMLFAQDAAPTNVTPENTAVTDTATNTTTAQPNTDSNLSITGAYVQPLIAGQKNTAAYMIINNNSQKTYLLVGATSSVADRVELHSVLMENGMVKMRPVDTITLLPQQQVALQPGDLHLMLIDVNIELTKDTLVPICLEIKDSANICMDVPVVDKRTTQQHIH